MKQGRGKSIQRLLALIPGDDVLKEGVGETAQEERILPAHELQGGQVSYASGVLHEKCVT